MSSNIAGQYNQLSSLRHPYVQRGQFTVRTVSLVVDLLPGAVNHAPRYIPYSTGARPVVTQPEQVIPGSQLNHHALYNLWGSNRASLDPPQTRVCPVDTGSSQYRVSSDHNKGGLPKYHNDTTTLRGNVGLQRGSPSTLF